mmetsp:Transcript_7959/g.22565  ORF Transcript_7959/g.22565 Transcript_7959/m.22565 type:complete len:210 (+) Transcript_7959:708-1337(+)
MANAASTADPRPSIKNWCISMKQPIAIPRYANKPNRRRCPASRTAKSRHLRPPSLSSSSDCFFPVAAAPPASASFWSFPSSPTTAISTASVSSSGPSRTFPPARSWRRSSRTKPRYVSRADRFRFRRSTVRAHRITPAAVTRNATTAKQPKITNQNNVTTKISPVSMWVHDSYSSTSSRLRVWPSAPWKSVTRSGISSQTAGSSTSVHV